MSDGSILKPRVLELATDMLSSLPVELLTKVVAHLEWEDYAACRLTCTRIEAAMFSSFARDSFTTCRVMRTPESIQTLIDISKSRLSPFVKQLGVSTEVLCSTNNSGKASLTADQDAFISTGRDIEMLTEALLKLQSIHRIQIRDIYSAAPFNLSTAPRGPSAKQRSLGLRNILLEQERIEGAESRTFPTVPGDVHFARTCLHSTLLALGKANGRPKELDFKAHIGFGGKVFQIPASIESSAIPVLAQLETLCLSLWTGSNVFRAPSPPRERPRKIPTNDVRFFLQHTTRVRFLDLNFNHLGNEYDGFIEWLASAPSVATCPQNTLPQPAPAIAFNCLEELSLHYILGIRMQSLLSVARKFATTLQKLHLHQVDLETSLQDQSSGSRAPGSVWTEFLHALKTELGNKLRCLHLEYVLESERIDSFRDPQGVTFAKGEKHYRSCYYSGPAMEQALEAMIHYIEGDSSWKPPSSEGNWGFCQEDSHSYGFL